MQQARENEAKALELRAVNNLARAWHARQRTHEAHGLLSELCNWFGPSAHSADVDEARALLAELSTVAPRRASATAGPATRSQGRRLQR